MAAPKKRVCGISDYAAFLYKAMGPKVECSWFDLPTTSSICSWRRAAARADDAQIAHVHFEPSLFKIPRPYINRFSTFMRRLRPPALVSLHNKVLPIRPFWSDKRPYGFWDVLRDLAYLPFFCGWEKSQYRRAGHFLVHSPELAAIATNFAGPHRVTHLFHPIPSVGRVWSPVEDHSLDLISLGFIKKNKGYQDLLDVVRHWPSLTWDVAGSPQDEYDRDFSKHFKSRIIEMELSGRIRITGYLSRERLEELAIRAKAAIFPFRWAAGSGTLTWAIGLGLPILATDLPAVVQFKEAGAGVELLPLNDPTSWAKRIAGILNDPEEQATLSEANLKFARQHGYIEFARQVEGLYRFLVNKGGAK
jgi:glycosyltransferase involved in cell wall biosynthesis